jgi:predicted transcriptional regulator
VTDSKMNGLENRMDRLEEVLSSAGNFLLQASALAQQNTTAIDRLAERIDRNFSFLLQASDLAQQNTIAIDRLTQRVDSLAAASERHDRILDYLLGQQRNSDN